MAATRKATEQKQVGVIQSMPVKPTENTKIDLSYKRDKYREVVRGRFDFKEVPGGTMSFVYREFDGDPVVRYDLTDGCIYSIPRGVARHLNMNCSYPVHKHYSDENKGSLMKVGHNVRRCAFQSLEFMEDEDVNERPSLATVEHVG